MSVEKELEKYAPKFDMAAGYADSLAIIKENFQNMAENMVAIGFYLKDIRDKKLYREGGYNSFAEFAKTEFGLSEAYASRYVSINDRFSIDGNSPFILEDKKAFSKSQLQEMLRLSDEQLEQVTPDMTVKEIRALATSQEIEIDIEEPEEQIPGQLDIDFYPEVLPEGYKTQEEMETVEAVEVANEEMPVEFAKAEVVIDGEYREIETSEENSEVETEMRLSCLPLREKLAKAFIQRYQTRLEDACNMQTEVMKILDTEHKFTYPFDWDGEKHVHIAEEEAGHIKARKAENGEPVAIFSAVDFAQLVVDINLRPVGSENIEIKQADENEVVHTSERQQDQESQKNTQTEEKEVTPHSVLETAKVRLHNMLQTEKQHGQSEAGHRQIESQKIIVAALAAMVTELDGIVDESDGMVMPVQPELPIMKNNEQRAAFIDAYSEWPIWIETKATGEKYYRYDFENGTSFVVRTYFHKCFDYKSHAKKWEERYTDDEGAQEYYILEEGKYFKDCLTNRSNMIDFLKRLQK